MIQIIDDVLADPQQYRAAALRRNFETFVFPEATFRGISVDALSGPVPAIVREVAPKYEPTLSFFRYSPEGQEEPHFIHTDVDMGDLSAILYLNPNPPEDDGTTFWTHLESGEIENPVPHLRSKEGKTHSGWFRRETVEAKFNRLVLFPSSWYHSRAIYDNWTAGGDSRLTQVTFCRRVH